MLRVRRRHNRELYTHVEKLTNTIGKRKIALYGHMTRVRAGRLINRIFAYILSMKTKAHSSPGRTGPSDVRITSEDVQKYNILKKKLGAEQALQEKSKLRAGTTWSEERTETH